MLISIGYLVRGHRYGEWSSRIWTCTGLALIAFTAALFGWLLTTHLCLEDMYHNSNNTITVKLSASWALVFRLSSS
jgi:hypothetical protein